MHDNPWYGYVMADDEVEDFLNSQAIGVLCLSQDERAYGIPMSFLYDEVNERLVMDFVFGDDSKKRSFLETTREACLTTFTWNNPQNWRSVVVTGPMNPIDPDDLDIETVSWYHSVARDIDVPGPAAELQWFALAIERMSGVAMTE